METTNTASYDRARELKAFDDMKTGVKGLVDADIIEIPRIFHHPHVNLQNPKPLSSDSYSTTIPTIDLEGGVYEDATTRRNVVEKMREAAEKWGFFQVINHGISLDVLENMKNGVVGFHEQDPEVKKGFYSRDFSRRFRYLSNFDLYSSEAANWRDTFSCYMAPEPPTPEDLPVVCGYVFVLL